MESKVLNCIVPKTGKRHALLISVPQLRKQINAVLESNMPESEKTGLHNLLGEILDLVTD